MINIGLFFGIIIVGWLVFLDFIIVDLGITLSFFFFLFLFFSIFIIVLIDVVIIIIIVNDIVYGNPIRVIIGIIKISC